MKKKGIIMMGATVILALVLSHQPPLTGLSQEFKPEHNEVLFKMDTVMLDSVIMYKLKIDSMKYEQEYSLETLRQQQKIISTFNKK